MTCDTALARRAATELPLGSVIAAQVREVKPGEILFPCLWWPGPDQGYRVVRHPARLVWELLCIGDEVTLEAVDGRIWTFCSFDHPMWPSDYLFPWIDIKESFSPKGHGLSERSSGAGRDEADGFVEPLHVSSSITGMTASGSFWRPIPEESVKEQRNLRISAKAVLNILAALVVKEERVFSLPEKVEHKALRPDLLRFFKTLELAEIDPSSRVVRPLKRREELVRAWTANDHDALFDLLRGWAPLNEYATFSDPPKRPVITQSSARALATLLGQGFTIEKTWFPGGRRPEPETMRKALLEYVGEREAFALPVYTLLVEIFLRRLGVSPVRIIRKWDQLWALGVFDGFEPREGGASSGKRVQEVAGFSRTGWALEKVDLEACNGVRDLFYRRAR